MKKEYNKLREELFNLRMEQTFQEKTKNKQDLIELEKEISRVKENLKIVIKNEKLLEQNKGGIKK